MNCILDASAVLRYIDDEAGADRVAVLIERHLAGTDLLMMSAIQWGELNSGLIKRHGRTDAEFALGEAECLGFLIVPATAERARRAAYIKSEYNLPYADAFAAELTTTTPDSVLITADFDFKAVAGLIAIEFLPANRPA